MMKTSLLYFQDEAEPALELADLARLTPQLVIRHDFPDGEFKLQLPSNVSSRAVIFRSLNHPNEKLIELIFTGGTARMLGVRHLTLVAPYLAYMRQDIAFVPGEVISQRIVGELLASIFDAVITVDPHLHRISKLKEAIPLDPAIVISAAPLLAEFVAKQRNNPFLIGPDAESVQWISQAALHAHLDYAVAKKIRHGDLNVEISFPKVNIKGRPVVILDDIASSGHTLAQAAKILLAAGALTVDVAVSHALFNSGAIELIKSSGVQNIWSANTVAHSSNAISVFPEIAKALKNILKQKLSY